jgi:competence protein ComEC
MSAPLDLGVRIAAAALAWLLGIGMQMQQPQLCPPEHYLALLLASLVLLLVWRALARRAPGSRVAAALCLCLALLLGFASTGWRAVPRLAQALPAELEAEDLQLTGVIAQMPQPGPQSTRFVFRVEQARRDGQPVTVPERVSLGWYRGFEGDAPLAAPPPELRAGQRWLLTARLRQPHGTLNPQGFDLELWMFEQGLRASGTVRASGGSINRLLADAAGYPVERARQAVRDAILLRVADAQAAGVLAALAVGDQAAIELGIDNQVLPWRYL